MHTHAYFQAVNETAQRDQSFEKYFLKACKTRKPALLKRNDLMRESTVCHLSADVRSVPGQHRFTHPTENLLACSVANIWDNCSRKLSGLRHQPQRLAQNSPVLDITTLQRHYACPSRSTCNWFLILHIIYFLQRGTVTLQESLVDCNLLHYWTPCFT